jgi:hypothetical protein
MSKFIAVALIVGSLFVGAVPAMAQVQGGVADPNTLAASGVVVPFFTSGVIGTTATLQVASPVGANPDAHMFFYNANCVRIPISVGIPLTTNDIAFQQLDASIVPAGTDGLVALAKADASGFALVPLDFPIHARMYAFNATDGRSRVLNPIIVNAAEFPSVAHWWSPLRSGGTFFAPLQTGAVNTDLLLICPLSSIVGATGAAFGADTGGGVGEATFTTQGFPQINPRLPLLPQINGIRVRVYDTFEVFLRDFTITCTCTTVFTSIATSINPIYGLAASAPFGTYTELTSVPGGPGINPSPRVTFTGYTSTGTTGSATNAFFAPIHSGSQLSIDGPAVVSER